MRLTGSAGMGRGTSRPVDQSVAVLRRAIELGVNHVDTAAFYFSADSAANHVIRTALAPYPDDLVIVTKVGPRRDPRRHLAGLGAPRGAPRWTSSATWPSSASTGSRSSTTAATAATTWPPPWPRSPRSATRACSARRRLQRRPRRARGGAERHRRRLRPEPARTRLRALRQRRPARGLPRARHRLRPVLHHRRAVARGRAEEQYDAVADDRGRPRRDACPGPDRLDPRARAARAGHPRDRRPGPPRGERRRRLAAPHRRRPGGARCPDLT